MLQRSHVLLADDDDTFAEATRELLRLEGYECDRVPDASAAFDRTLVTRYDVLVSDIRMRGNEHLELIRQIAASSAPLPVVLVTAYPSVATAVAAFKLPVVGYLVKPFEFTELLGIIRTATRRYRAELGLDALRHCLQEPSSQPEIAEALRPAPGSINTGIAGFYHRALRNAAAAIADLQVLTAALEEELPSAQPCDLMSCPRAAEYRGALRDTVEVLEKTKGAFRSRELGDLRHRLEALLAAGHV